MQSYLEILADVIRIAAFQDRHRSRRDVFPRLGEVDLEPRRRRRNTGQEFYRC